MRRHLKRVWQLWGDLSLGAVLIVVATGLVGSIYGLRSNNLGMIERREAVFTADSDDEDVEAALQELRSHILGHMNTNLVGNSDLAIEGEQPIQLVHTYYRKNIDSYRALAAANGASADPINQAVAICQEREISTRLSCINQEATRIGGSSYPLLDPLNKDLYVFDFHSPRWSPDLAGFSLVILAFGITLLTLRFIVGAIISRLIRS